MKKKPLALIIKAQAAIIFVSICTALPAISADISTISSPLPQLGDTSEMTSAAERRLGDRIARELYRDPDFVDDPILSNYIQSIWQPLLTAARQRGELTPELEERFAWRIVLGRDRSVNAFALPGGYLGVHLGLMAVVSSRDELASVLGHELSHVTQRHIARLMSKNSQQTPWMIGAMILGALAASKNANTGNALIVGGQALSAQAQLNFSRDMEREADRIGFGVMTQAGFEAQGFVSMFDKLQQASRLNDSGAYPYLRSHPLTTERIADMQSRVSLGSTHTLNTTPTLAHAMLTARARVLSNPGLDAMQNWQTRAQDAAFSQKPQAEQAGILYGAAMSASRMREPAKARTQFARLQKITASDASAQQQTRWLGVEIGLLARDLSRPQVLALGETIGLEASQPQPTLRPDLLLQAQVAMQSGQAQALDSVAQRLQTWLVDAPLDALAWQWLGSVYAAQNQPLRALRAEAEARIAQLDYAGAIDRLKAAQERFQNVTSTSANHIEASIIDTRKRQIEALVKAQSAEK
ncbi:MAG: M48 family metalloprotease [Rhodoferax sp.]|nr:M48 family metalloprotease [Rhodoferax sp.]MDD5481157.1 M48 family metalloprotease [Rhodoferax sp.]